MLNSWKDDIFLEGQNVSIRDSFFKPNANGVAPSCLGLQVIEAHVIIAVQIVATRKQVTSRSTAGKVAKSPSQINITAESFILGWQLSSSSFFLFTFLKI